MLGSLHVLKKLIRDEIQGFGGRRALDFYAVEKERRRSLYARLQSGQEIGFDERTRLRRVETGDERVRVQPDLARDPSQIFIGEGSLIEQK